MNRRIMFSSNGSDWGRKISNSRGLTLLGVQIAVSQFQIVLLFFSVSYSENCRSLKG